MIKELLGWGIRSKSKSQGFTAYFSGINYGFGRNTETEVIISKNMLNAKIFSNFEELLKSFRSLKSNKTKCDLDTDELTIIKIYNLAEEINLFEGDTLQEIQKRGIKKLESDEIEALGIKDKALYSKLKEVSLNTLEDFYPDEIIAKKNS